MSEFSYKQVLKSQAVHSVCLMGVRGVSLIAKFGFTLFIAKYLGFRELGIYGLIVAVSVMGPSIFGFGIMQKLSRDAITHSRDKTALGLGRYAKLTILTYSILFIITIFVAAHEGQIMLAILVFFVVFLEHINNDLYVLQLNLSQPFVANFLHFIRSALWMFIYMASIWISPELISLESILTAWIFGSLLSLAIFLWTVRNYPWKRELVDYSIWPWVRIEFVKSKHLYLTGLVTTASHYVNHFIIVFFLGLELTGVYIFFMQVLSAMSNLVQTGVMQFARPKMVRAFIEQKPEHKMIFIRCMKDTFLTAAAMAIIAGPVMHYVTFDLVKRPLAMEWFHLFWPLLLLFVGGIVSEVHKMYLYSMHKDKTVLLLTMISLTGGLMLNAYTIPALGLWGVVVASGFMLVVILIIQFRLTTSSYKS